MQVVDILDSQPKEELKRRRGGRGRKAEQEAAAKPVSELPAPAQPQQQPQPQTNVRPSDDVLAANWKVVLGLMGTVFGRVVGYAVYKDSKVIGINTTKDGRVAATAKFGALPRHLKGFWKRPDRDEVFEAALKHHRDEYHRKAVNAKWSVKAVEARDEIYAKIEANWRKDLTEYVAAMQVCCTFKDTFSAGNRPFPIAEAFALLVAPPPTARQYQTYLKEHGLDNLVVDAAQFDE